MARKTSNRIGKTATDVAEGSRRLAIAIDQQRQLLRSAAARLAAAGSGAVHHGRVAARRMRSLLKTFGPLVDARSDRLLRADLRSFARSLASTRETDVRRDLLLGLVRRHQDVTPADVERLGAMLDECCREARDSLGRRAAEPGWSALLDAIEREATVEYLRLRSDASLADVLERVDDAWQKAERQLLREPTAVAELHELRLALKHFRYAIEPVADLGEAEAAELLVRLRKAQDRIGEHRDTLLAADWVRANARALGSRLAPRLLALLARHEQRLRKQAARRARDVLPAGRRWRRATRRLRKGTTTGPARR